MIKSYDYRNDILPGGVMLYNSVNQIVSETNTLETKIFFDYKNYFFKP